MSSSFSASFFGPKNIQAGQLFQQSLMPVENADRSNQPKIEQIDQIKNNPTSSWTENYLYVL